MMKSSEIDADNVAEWRTRVNDTAWVMLIISITEERCGPVRIIMNIHIYIAP